MKRNGIKIYLKAFALFIFIALIALLFVFFKHKKGGISSENVSAFKISAQTINSISEIADKYELSFTKLLTLYMVQNDFFNEKLYIDENIERILIPNMNNIEEECNKFPAYYTLIDNIVSDIKVFPLKADSGYVYSDSWGAERTYGGKRIHQGCDIFDRENICGRLEVISMTDGIVENIGWNEKGGYRIGIRSETGNYYYYAHFSEYYKSFIRGDTVKAGDILGYMGDSGYGEEGTTGKFAVHLHIGICAETEISKGEFWINPYPFLVYAEKNNAS